MRDAILATITNDLVLRHILIGGIYQHTQITPEYTPLAFAQGCWIRPCAIVRWGRITSETMMRTRGLRNVTRQEFCIFFYEDARLCDGQFVAGYGAIEQARRRVRDLLHRRTIRPLLQQPVGAVYGQVATPDAYVQHESGWQVRHESDLLEFYDDQLAGQGWQSGWQSSGKIDLTSLVARCTRSCYQVHVRGGGCC